MAKKFKSIIENEMGSTAPASFDTWVAEAQVRVECGDLSSMTIHRYDQDERLKKLGWPPPIYIRGRKYRSRRMLEEFKERMLQLSLANRGKLPEQYEHANEARLLAKKAKASPKRQAA